VHYKQLFEWIRSVGLCF